MYLGLIGVISNNQLIQSGVMSTTEEENEWICKDGSAAQRDPAAQRLVSGNCKLLSCSEGSSCSKTGNCNLVLPLNGNFSAAQRDPAAQRLVIVVQDNSKQKSPESLEWAKPVRTPCFHFGFVEFEFEFQGTKLFTLLSAYKSGFGHNFGLNLRPIFHLVELAG